MGKRYSVAVDFDGVIHSYTTPWIDAATIPDPPVEGAIEWLNEIQHDFDVVIFTTRAQSEESCWAVRHYLRDHQFEGWAMVAVTNEKPPCLIYLDDRAYRFEGPGTFPTAEDVHRARPWNKRTPTNAQRSSPESAAGRMADRPGEAATCEFILRGDYNDCAHAAGGRGAPLADWCKPCLTARLSEAERLAQGDADRLLVFLHRAQAAEARLSDYEQALRGWEIRDNDGEPPCSIQRHVGSSLQSMVEGLTQDQADCIEGFIEHLRAARTTEAGHPPTPGSAPGRAALSGSTRPGEPEKD